MSFGKKIISCFLLTASLAASTVFAGEGLREFYINLLNQTDGPVNVRFIPHCMETVPAKQNLAAGETKPRLVFLGSLADPSCRKANSIHVAILFFKGNDEKVKLGESAVLDRKSGNGYVLQPSSGNDKTNPSIICSSPESGNRSCTITLKMAR